MSERSVVIHSSSSSGQYFFSTDHLQGVRSKETYPQDFVPITFYLPKRVVPRPSLPTGVVETVADLVAVFFPTEKEIPNPDPNYQPK